MHNFSFMFISILYMFLAAMCPSSGELIVSMRHLVYVILCRWPSGIQVGMKQIFIPTCIPDGHLHRLTCTKCRIDTINSPDDGHMAARKHVENKSEHIRKIVHQVGLFAKTIVNI